MVRLALYFPKREMSMTDLDEAREVGANHRPADSHQWHVREAGRKLVSPTRRCSTSRSCGMAGQFGQIVESTPSRPMQYYLVLKADAGSVPCSTTTYQRSRPLSGRDFFWNFQMATTTYALSLASAGRQKSPFFPPKPPGIWRILCFSPGASRACARLFSKKSTT